MGAQDLLQALFQIKLIYVFWLVVIAILLNVVSAVKWRLFIRAHGHDATIWHLFKLYMVGNFFNAFSPSYLVGDVTRTLRLGKSLESQKDAFVSTFLERFTGLVAMAFIGVIFVIIGNNATQGVQWAVVAVAVPVFIGATMCFSESIGWALFKIVRMVAGRLVPGRYRDTVRKFIVKVEEAINVSRTNKILLVKAFALSFVYHILAVLNVYVCGLAVGWESPSISGLCVVVPLVLLVSMVPVTPSGLGIQEGAFLFFLQRIGATRSQGLAVGVLLRAKFFVVALVGGFIWMGLKKSDKEAQDAVA